VQGIYIKLNVHIGRFVSISAGSDHLLALTSSGRVFTHPISKNANSHGQLGLRTFDVPDSSDPSSDSRVPIELIPKALADPYAKATPAGAISCSRYQVCVV